MAQSETKEYAIANDKKKNTHIRKEKSCLEKCLISYKKKHSEKSRKSSIWIINPVQPVWEIIHKTLTHRSTHIHTKNTQTTYIVHSIEQHWQKLTHAYTLYMVV